MPGSGRTPTIASEVDRNGDGEIQYVEFVDWLMRPVVTAGAAALLSTAKLCYRADSSTIGSPAEPAEGGETRWTFRGTPIRLDAAHPLPKERRAPARPVLRAASSSHAPSRQQPFWAPRQTWAALCRLYSTKAPRQFVQ